MLLRLVDFLLLVIKILMYFASSELATIVSALLCFPFNNLVCRGDFNNICLLEVFYILPVLSNFLICRQHVFLAFRGFKKLGSRQWYSTRRTASKTSTTFTTLNPTCDSQLLEIYLVRSQQSLTITIFYIYLCFRHCSCCCSFSFP
jgi:hypothetical protein